MSDIESKKVNNETVPRKKRGLKLRAKLAMVFIAVMIIPIVILTAITWNQITTLGNQLREMSVSDSTTALIDNARDNLERMTTDTAAAIADFMHQRDRDILLLASFIPSEEAYKVFSDNRQSKLTTIGEWKLSDDGLYWVEVNPLAYDGDTDVSSNRENNDILESGFHYRPPEFFTNYQEMFPLYDEVTFVNLDGQEIFKYVSPDSTKTNYPMSSDKADVTNRLNTYIKAETYWEQLQMLQPGEIYVSDVIGAYVGTNYIGMYTPGVLKNEVPQSHPNYDELQRIANLPIYEFIEVAKQQAFAGKENPFGQRFEGIVRWATPLVSDGEIVGYVTMALNHDHIMEFVDYITPMKERYTVLSNAHEGNYAFIWDYKCRSIAHPRHHSIVGFNPLTGEPQVPWLEGSLMLQRDFVEGGFVLDEDRRSIPILDEHGNPQPATDTPFYHWFTNGGSRWLEANPAWNNLSAGHEGTSWGEFYEANREDREMLPQFGERPLRDLRGNTILDKDGDIILDYQSRRKAPARELTAAGFVGLDGRYLNNAPQCTGWMDLTENGGSGSFYILWSEIYKPTTAGAIPYYTGKYSPEVQGNKRGFAFVTIGSGIEDFTAPAMLMEERLIETINTNLRGNIEQLLITSIIVFTLIIMVVILVASTVTKRIKQLVAGIYRFRIGERQFRMHSPSTDEFGMLADSFDEMADSIENSVKAPLVITDLDEKVIYMNTYAQDKVGRKLEEVVGVPYGEISMYPKGSNCDPVAALHEGREAEVYKAASAFDTGDVQKDENIHYYKGTANYCYDSDGIIIGYIIVTNDVTDIQVARQRAEIASIAKSNFLSNMSHEIRTPLNAIIGMTSIGRASKEKEKKDYSLGKIYDASKHLLGIINDILDVSKIEANKFSLSTARFSIDELLERVVDVISLRVEQKQQILTVRIDDDMPEVLVGDDQRLMQVIMNLLSNAVKFTAEHGQINLDVKLERAQSDFCTLRVAVTDNGIGISEEQQERLFLPFEQAEASTSRRFGGTGLGLVICKSIVEMMGGRIWVDSELGEGATVAFTVRLAYDHSGKKSPLHKKNTGDNRLSIDDSVTEAKGSDFSGFSVLLAEDVEINREIVLALLEPTKLKIDCAENGSQAVDAFISNPAKYDMIFMDIQMPEMDGFTATKNIRSSGVERSTEVPIIAMTANAFKEDIDKCLESGMNGHIGKPLDLKLVIETLEKYLRKS